MTMVITPQKYPVCKSFVQLFCSTDLHRSSNTTVALVHEEWLDTDAVRDVYGCHVAISELGVGSKLII